MPNECFNVIEVRGDKTEIERMLKLTQTEENRGFDFNTIVPYPENYARLDYQAEIEEKKGNNQFVSGWASGGSKWTIEHWGQKWNAYSPSVDYSENEEEFASISFTTAWRPSLPVTQVLSKQFPTLTFRHKYEEPDMDFSGYSIFRNGEIVEDQVGGYGDFQVLD